MFTSGSIISSLGFFCTERIIKHNDYLINLQGKKVIMSNMAKAMREHCGCDADVEKAAPIMAEYIATTRALHLWFHGAHNVTRGTGFAGDHELIYGKIYQRVQDDIDGLIEKAVGLLEDEELACPTAITSRAAEILSDYPSPSRMTSLAIAAAGKSLVKAYLKFLSHISDELKASGVMTLGLEDFISSAANEYETFVYLLQQREKSELQN